MDTFHPSLKRLLRTTRTSETAPPDSISWAILLDRVNGAFQEMEKDRYLLERSMDLSSAEMLERAEALRVSEERWRTLLETAPDVIINANLDGSILFANRGFLDHPKAAGSYIFELFHDFDLARWQQIIAEMTEIRRAIEIEVRGVGAKESWYSVRASATFDSSGTPYSITLILTDITQTRALREENARFRVLINKARDGIVVVDPRQFGLIVDANETFLRLAGISREQALSSRLQDHCKNIASELTALWGQDHRQKTPPIIQSDSTLICGEQAIPVDIFVSYHRMANGGYFLASFEDVSHRRAMEHELEAERAKAVFAAKMSTLGEMAGGVAHEINNPITAIQGLAWQINKLSETGQFEKERFQKQSRKILDLVDRIAKIVKGLQTFSRDGTRDKMQPTPLQTIFEDTLSLCSESLKIAGVELKVEAFPEISVECRATEICQVLLNLIFNARDAITGSESPWIALSAVSSTAFVEFVVTDSGRGIPDNLREKIMQPFFTTKIVGKGTGLGLSISRGIAEAHGGTLTYDDSSKNTCFIMRLPITTPKDLGLSNQLLCA